MNNIERITQDIFDSLSKPFATIRGISTATKKNTYRVVNIVKLKQIKHSVLIPVFLSISVCHYFLSNNAQAQPRNYGAVIACDASMGEGFGFNFRNWNSGGAYCNLYRMGNNKLPVFGLFNWSPSSQTPRESTAYVLGFDEGSLQIAGNAGIRVEGPASFINNANFNNNKITALANATDDQDAVNGSQLRDTLKGFGGGAGLNTDGTVKAPTYAINGKTYNSFGDALAHMQTAPGVENPYIKISPIHGVVDTESRAAGDIAIGVGAIVDSQAKDDGLHHASAIGMGEEARGFGENSIAIGTHAFVGSRDGKMRTDSSIALGAYSSVTRKNAVALGFQSQADRANAVSVGSPDALRQIIYVGKGTADTDGVNVSQLKGALAGLGGGAGLDKDGTVKKPSYNINGKAYNTVGDALANVQAGPGADSPYIKIDGDTPASNNVSGGISIGSNTKAEGITGGRGTIAIGQNAISRDARRYTAGIAIGLSSVAESGAVALGPEAQATQTNGVALGTLSVADREGSGSGPRAISGVSVGSKDVKRKIYNVASGTLNDEVVIIAQLKGALDSLGGGAGLNTDGTVKKPSYTVGGKTYTTVGDALANVQAGPGAENPYIKIQPTDHKNATEAKSPGDIAIGHGAVSESKGNNDAPHTSSVAIGELANVYGASGTALGSHTAIGTADKRVDNGVAIGDQSQVLANNSIAIGTQSSVDRANVVSIGHNKLLRQLIYLAKGTADTDGVNVSQLKGVLAGLGGGAALDKDGNVKAPAYTVGGKNYSSVSDALAHVQAGTDNPYIKVHGKTEARNAAIWGIAIGSNAQTAQAPGEYGAIAIGANASAGKEGYTGAIAIGPDSVAQQNSIVLGRNTNASALSVAVGMFANAVNNSVALGDHSVADRPNTVSVGSRTAPRQIVNVYRATMDRDAVNLSQLKGVLFGLGGGAGVNVDGVIQSPTYTIGGKVFNNVNDALASLDSRSSLSDVYLKVDGETQAVQTSKWGIAIGSGAKTHGALSGPGSEAYGAIAIGSNAIAGEKGYTGANAFGVEARAFKEAMAIGRSAHANDASIALGSYTKASNNSVALGNNSTTERMNTVSVGGETVQRQIINIAAGTLDNDAVIIGQLKSTLVGLGGGADLKADGSIQAPTYTIGGKTFHTVSDALTNLEFREGLKDTYIKVDGEKEAVANGKWSVALGSNARTQGASNGSNIYGAIAIGPNALAGDIGHSGAVAVGADSQALKSAIAIGWKAFADDTSAALGVAAKASRNSVALGNNSTTERMNTVSVGGETVQRQIIHVAPGTVDNDAVTIAQLKAALSDFGGGAGLNANGSVEAPTYTVDGKRVRNVGDALKSLESHAGLEDKYIKVMGETEALADAKLSIAIGSNAKTQGTKNDPAEVYGAIAIGSNALAGNNGYAGAIAFGAQSKALKSATAIGWKSFADDTSVALGASANAINNSVALGAGSVSDRMNAVSVGNTKLLRQLIYLGRGTADTDAVNISQFKGALLGLGGGAGLNADGSVKAPSYTVGNQTFDNVGDALRNIKLSRGLDDKYIKVAGEKEAQNLGKWGISIGSNAQTMNTGASYGAMAIGPNAQAGSADYPGAMAIGADSKALKNAIALGWKSSADDTSAALGLSAQAHADSIALGAYSMTDRPHSVSVGSKTALRQLTYLANGTMLTDAVNVRQFKGAVNVFGGGAIVNPDGTVKTPHYRMDGGSAEFSSVGDALRNLDERLTNLSSMKALTQANDSPLKTLALSDKAGKTSGKNTQTNPENSKRLSGRDADSKASGEHHLVLGDNAQASGARSSAFGDGADTMGADSVALGSGSTDDGRNHVVSIGSEGNERQITHVKAGTADTDAATVGQMNAAIDTRSAHYDHNSDGSIDDKNMTFGANGKPVALHNIAAGTADNDAVNVEQLNQGLNNTLAKAREDTDERFDSFKRNADAGVAAALAATGLPQPSDPGKSVMAVAGGLYQGQSAVAVGLSTITSDSHWIFKVSGTTNNRGKIGGIVGAGYQW